MHDTKQALKGLAVTGPQFYAYPSGSLKPSQLWQMARNRWGPGSPAGWYRAWRPGWTSLKPLAILIPLSRGWSAPCRRRQNLSRIEFLVSDLFWLREGVVLGCSD